MTTQQQQEQSMRPPLEEVAATLRPSDLGGVATAAAAAAAQEETGRQPRAPPATSEERVAVGSRVNWVHLCGDEAIARGRAEATERQRLGRALIAKEEQLAAAKARAVENAAELQALRIFKAEKDREAAALAKAVKKAKGPTLEQIQLARIKCEAAGRQ